MGACASRTDHVVVDHRKNPIDPPRTVSLVAEADTASKLTRISVADVTPITETTPSAKMVLTDDVWDDENESNSPTMSPHAPSTATEHFHAEVAPANNSLESAETKKATKSSAADSRRRRLSVSTVVAASTNSGSPEDVHASDDQVAKKGTEERRKADDARSSDGKSSARNEVNGSMRKATVKFKDPALELVDQSSGGSVKEVTLGMLKSLFPQSEHYAVFGSPSYGIQRGYDNKPHEVGGVMPIGKTLRNIGVGYACKKGLKPESPNQDDFFVLRVDDWAIYGVFDGHGPSGHDISAFVHKTLPFLLIGDPSFDTDVKASLRRAFLRVHELVGAISDQSDSNLDCSLSGTTGTVIVHRDKQLIIAHVGDSRAVLARQAEPGSKKLVATDLTQDHKPTLPHERERIESSGGEVKRLDGDVPHRVFVKHQMYPGMESSTVLENQCEYLLHAPYMAGLAMSRAIGDILAVSVGVTPTPEISVIDLTCDDVFFVIATDGVWEFITSQEAVDIVTKKPSSKVNESSGESETVISFALSGSRCESVVVSELLAYEAWRRWVAEEENVVDDVTCIVIWLNTDEAMSFHENGKSRLRGGRRSSLPAASQKGAQKIPSRGPTPAGGRRDQRCGSVAAARPGFQY